VCCALVYFQWLISIERIHNCRIRSSPSMQGALRSLRKRWVLRRPRRFRLRWRLLSVRLLLPNGYPMSRCDLTAGARNHAETHSEIWTHGILSGRPCTGHDQFYRRATSCVSKSMLLISTGLWVIGNRVSNRLETIRCADGFVMMCLEHVEKRVRGSTKCGENLRV